LVFTYTNFHHVGRGILLDYAEWAASQSPPITYSTFSTHSIPFTTILALCKHYDVTPRKGDILFIRTGVIPEWDSFSDEQKQDYAAQVEPKHAGVEACLETLEWLWNSGIAAVAGDAISWEVSFRSLYLPTLQPTSFARTQLIGGNVGFPYSWRDFDP
jgi:hypothetical protein